VKMGKLLKERVMILTKLWFYINLPFKSMQSLVLTSRMNSQIPLKSTFKHSNYFTNFSKCS